MKIVKPRNINFRISVNIYIAIKKFCKDNNISISNLIRNYFEFLLNGGIGK